MVVRSGVKVLFVTFAVIVQPGSLTVQSGPDVNQAAGLIEVAARSSDMPSMPWRPYLTLPVPCSPATLLPSLKTHRSLEIKHIRTYPLTQTPCWPDKAQKQRVSHRREVTILKTRLLIAFDQLALTVMSSVRRRSESCTRQHDRPQLREQR